MFGNSFAILQIDFGGWKKMKRGEENFPNVKYILQKRIRRRRRRTLKSRLDSSLFAVKMNHLYCFSVHSVYVSFFSLFFLSFLLFNPSSPAFFTSLRLVVTSFIFFARRNRYCHHENSKRVISFKNYPAELVHQ